MTLRTHLTAKQRLAHEILDRVKAGVPVEAASVRWALCALGDGTD